MDNNQDVAALKEELISTFNDEDSEPGVKNMVPVLKYKQLKNENENLILELEGYRNEAHLAKDEAERKFEKFKAQFIAEQASRNKHDIATLTEEFNPTFNGEYSELFVNNVVPIQEYEELKNDYKNLMHELEDYKNEVHFARDEAERKFEKFKAQFIAEQASRNKHVQRRSSVARGVSPDEAGTYESCIYCNSTTHGVLNCGAFQARSVADRRRIVLKTKACYYCLELHIAKNCPQPVTCVICSGDHNELLCRVQARTESQSSRN